ncbi:MAG: PilZ domain-containing protein [Planctomycetota bacterium]
MDRDAAKDQIAHDERRSDVRRPGTDEASIRLVDESLTGTLGNLSDGGLFVVLDQPLTLEVTLGAESGVPPRRARLIRCQSLPGGKSGWGLQFDLDDIGD